MVTIFDMVTGELIHNDAPSETGLAAKPATAEHSLIAPRLQTVEEAVATQPSHCLMPADVVSMDIGRFIDQY